jgi:hypothetical protein
MDNRFSAQLISWAFGFFGAVYVTLLGYRVVGTPPGQNLEVDLWHERYGRKRGQEEPWL